MHEEDTGFLTCPNCRAPWDSEQWLCGSCGNTDKPKALQVYAPWAWYLAFAILGVIWLIDRANGGHLWAMVSHWFKTS